MPPLHKIKLGFVSQLFDFNHIVGSLVHNTLEKLDRELFHIEIFYFGTSSGENTDIFRICDHVSNLYGLNLPQTQEKIAERQLDILIYPEVGMESKTYFLAFSRLAPVQCVLPGHPITTGIPNIDYYVSCAAHEPEDAQHHYTEKLICLTDSPPFFQKKPTIPHGTSIRLQFNLEADWHLYACPQMLFKCHPDMDNIFAAILQHDPNGRLLLIDTPARYLATVWLQRFQAKFPDVTNRVIFLDRLPYDHFCALLEQADVLLDPIHFGGGTTTAAAFAMGAPVVTMANTFLRGRGAASGYVQMGVTDAPVATDAENYVQLALRLAQDKAWQQGLRQAISQRNHVLFERLDAIRELESFLMEAHHAAKERRPLTWPR